jgi:hypothetical protein
MAQLPQPLVQRAHLPVKKMMTETVSINSP